MIAWAAIMLCNLPSCKDAGVVACPDAAPKPDASMPVDAISLDRSASDVAADSALAPDVLPAGIQPICADYWMCLANCGMGKLSGLDKCLDKCKPLPPACAACVDQHVTPCLKKISGCSSPQMHGECLYKYCSKEFATCLWPRELSPFCLPFESCYFGGGIIVCFPKSSGAVPGTLPGNRGAPCSGIDPDDCNPGLSCATLSPGADGGVCIPVINCAIAPPMTL